MSRDTSRSSYDDGTDETGDRAGDQYADDGPSSARYEDEDTFPRFVPFGWPPAFSRNDPDDQEPVTSAGESDDDYDNREDPSEGTWVDEGLITLTILVGVVLFLIPEPATSSLGILLILLGAVAWVVDAVV